jgi:parallel beta-helix repeat protein
MSLIKANAVQVGQSPTATQNFTLAVPSSPDGTIKLARGNAGATTQDVLSVDASGNINGIVKATGSTASRSLANRFADVVNVKDFGAVGDGVTDDTIAIQSAINITTEVFFPSGTYIVSSLLIPSDTTLSGEAGPSSIIKRKNNTSNGYFIKANIQKNIGFYNLTIDGNKANQTVGYHNLLFTECEEVSIKQCKLINAKTFAGISIEGGTNEENISRSIIEGNFFEDNDNSGIYINKESYISIEANHFTNNGGDGITVINYVFPPVSNVQNYFIINGNRCIQNVNGIRFVGFYEGGTPSQPFPGPLMPPQKCVIISNNICKSNSQYGIAFQGVGGNVFGNYCERNGTTVSDGGILANCWNTSVTNNIIYDNAYWGIDAGGSRNVIVSNNVVSYQGLTSGLGGNGVNIGGSVNSQVSDNILEANGTTGTASSSIYSSGYEFGGSWFEQTASNISITSNTITLGDPSRIGIYLNNGGNNYIISNNQITAASANKAFILQGGTETLDLFESNNVDWSNAPGYTVIASASSVIIPDIGSNIFISGTTNINNILTFSDNQLSGKVRFVEITNGGSGYNPALPPSVSFSGGGGAGAAGTALVSNSGKVIGVQMTNLGSGYTSAPTVAFGSGAATGNAKIGCNNFFNRVIRLQFLGSLTVNTGGNLVLSSAYSASSGKVLTLKGAFGNWYEVSRT